MEKERVIATMEKKGNEIPNVGLVKTAKDICDILAGMGHGAEIDSVRCEDGSERMVMRCWLAGDFGGEGTDLELDVLHNTAEKYGLKKAAEWAESVMALKTTSPDMLSTVRAAKKLLDRDGYDVQVGMYQLDDDSEKTFGLQCSAPDCCNAVFFTAKLIEKAMDENGPEKAVEILKGMADDKVKGVKVKEDVESTGDDAAEARAEAEEKTGEAGGNSRKGSPFIGYLQVYMKFESEEHVCYAVFDVGMEAPMTREDIDNVLEETRKIYEQMYSENGESFSASYVTKEEYEAGSEAQPYEMSIQVGDGK